MTFQAIGTHWQIDLPTEVDVSYWEKKIRERLELFESTYSRFRPHSQLSIMSQRPGEYMLDQDGHAILAMYKKLYDLTEGAFTPLIGSVLSQAGYDADYSFKESILEPPRSWDDALDYQFPRLNIRQSVGLDFGGVGKGYAIDVVADMLRAERVTEFCIDAGGDILQASVSEQIMRVGLEDPNDTGRVIGVANVENESICGSSGNRRVWGKFHHLIDPRTLTSPSNVLASWVIANTAIIADSLATCLFFVPPEKLTNAFSFDYVILYADRSARSSSGFSGELFSKE